MCVSVLNKKGENTEKIEPEKTDPKNKRDKKVQKKEKNVQKKRELKEKSTKKGEDADWEMESEKSSHKKGK